MIRLAHLSDIHLTVPKLEWTRPDWFNKRLAAWFNFRCLGRGRRFCHADRVLERLMTEVAQRSIDQVIFSGDASALGFAAEIEKSARLLGVGMLPGLAVPGNHDYCTRLAARSGNFERAFAPWQQGLRIDGEVYPFARKVGPVWLIAVNSSTGNRWAWDAGGAVGLQQRSRLEKLLAQLDGGPRILVTHFPVCLVSGKPERKTHGLRDLSDVVRVASEGGVSLWLHGHRHGLYYFQKSEHAPFPIICAGSATQSYRWSYGEYVIDGWKLQGTRRSFNLAAGAFEDREKFELNLVGDPRLK